MKQNVDNLIGNKKVTYYDTFVNRIGVLIAVILFLFYMIFFLTNGREVCIITYAMRI